MDNHGSLICNNQMMSRQTVKDCPGILVPSQFTLCLRGPSHPSEMMARAPAIEPKLQHQEGRRVEGKGHMAFITRNQQRIPLTSHTLTIFAEPKRTYYNFSQKS